MEKQNTGDHLRTEAIAAEEYMGLKITPKEYQPGATITVKAGE